jgi:hypothetical protein
MLSPEQRRWRADKIGDLANIAVGALIFGQAFAGSFHRGAAIAGVVILLLAFFYGNRLLKHL